MTLPGPGPTEPAATAAKHAEVFLSFADEDRELARTLEAKIEALGLRCWSFLSDQEVGHWDRKIAEVIQRCKVVVLVLTKAANTSDVVQAEIALAFKAKRQILPLRLDRSLEPQDGLALYLVNRHWSHSIEELLRLLPPPEPPAPTSGLVRAPEPPIEPPPQGETSGFLDWPLWAYVVTGLSLVGLLVVFSQVFCPRSPPVVPPISGGP